MQQKQPGMHDSYPQELFKCAGWGGACTRTINTRHTSLDLPASRILAGVASTAVCDAERAGGCSGLQVKYHYFGFLCAPPPSSGLALFGHPSQNLSKSKV